MLPYLPEQPLLRLLHALDHLLTLRTARKLVGVRQQRTFARHLAQRAREDVIVLQPLNDLLRRQPFRNSEGMLHHLALDDGVDDVGQTRVFPKQEFTRLQRSARIECQHTADEAPPVRLGDALAQQEIADIGHARARRNIDDLVLGQRPFRRQHLLAVDVEPACAENQHQQDCDDGVACDHERIARTVGALRRRNLLRLKCRARTARFNGWPLTHVRNPNPFWPDLSHRLGLAI